MDIIPVQTGGELSEFVDLPFSLYGRESLWTPQLKFQERRLLTPGKHPFWQSARRQLFLAKNNGRAIGRIAAIVDSKYNDYAKEKCGSFGFFECQNNKKAAYALLGEAKKWLSAQGMSFMRGPLNPSANYACGLLVQGFERAPALMMPWNPRYYPELLETWGLRKEQDLFAYEIDRHNVQLAPWISEEIARLKKEGRFLARPASKATLKEDIRAILRIYQLAWANNWGFSPLSPEEAEEHVKELKGILDPDFFCLFFDGDKPVAGMVALPDMNPLLKRLNGKLGLASLWHYWASRKQIRQGMRIMLYGILPEYRLQGLPLLLLDYMLEKAKQRSNLNWVEGSWILEANPAMDELMEDFSGKLTKRYRIYRSEI